MLSSMPILALGQKIEYYNCIGEYVSKEKARYCYKIFEDSIKNNTVYIEKFLITGEPYQKGYYNKRNYEQNEGTTKQYNKYGNLKYKKEYLDGKLNGELIGYYPSGEIRRKEFYKKGKMISGKCFTKSGADTSYFPSFIFPTFKGKDIKRSFRFFVEDQLKYPEFALACKISGLVIINFIINEKGNLSKIDIVKSDNHILDQSAIEIIARSSDFWGKGYEEGEPSETNFIFPIRFKLEEEEKQY